MSALAMGLECLYFNEGFAMANTPRNKKSGTSDKHQPLPSSVKDSAQQIWQAGLGAFTRAQAEGTKAFEALVQEGITMQRKTQSSAEAKMAEAAGKMSSLASDITSKATGQWDKLETIFEDRVSKALGKLGVPSAKEVNELIARIDELSEAVHKLTDKATASQPTPAKVVRKTAKKPAAKSASSKKPVARKRPKA